MLSASQIIAYVPVADVPRARKFYEGTLGFRPLDTNEAGVMYESGGWWREDRVVQGHRGQHSRNCPATVS